MTFAVDWTLKATYLSIYLFLRKLTCATSSTELTNVTHSDKRGTKSLGRSRDNAAENIAYRGLFYQFLVLEYCFHIVKRLFCHILTAPSPG